MQKPNVYYVHIAKVHIAQHTDSGYIKTALTINIEEKWDFSPLFLLFFLFISHRQTDLFNEDAWLH